VGSVFSNAVICGILDHKKLFAKFWESLKQDGELLIQCGGKGNLGSTHTILEEIRKSKRFKHILGIGKIRGILQPQQTQYKHQTMQDLKVFRFS
jgi:trans-aconitate methyltransferase